MSDALESRESNVSGNGQRPQTSLGTAAARNLATTTKSVPQMQEITSRWLLRMLPWVQVKGGTYRVNRRLSYAVGDGRVTFTNTGAEVRVIPPELCELPLLRGFDDDEVLAALADRFAQREFAPGEVIVERGQPADQVFLIAHGKVNKIGVGQVRRRGGARRAGRRRLLRRPGAGRVGGPPGTSPSRPSPRHGAGAVPAGLRARWSPSPRRCRRTSPGSRPARSGRRTSTARPRSRWPPATTASRELPGTFVDYEATPREYELSVAQTVLRVHTRVADLYNEPMNQIEQQLRLTIEALRERQEHELVNNREFGLLHNADLKQRIHTRTGPAHPRRPGRAAQPAAQLAVLPRPPAGHRRLRPGVQQPRPLPADRRGRRAARCRAWRGVPIFPCNKIPVTAKRHHLDPRHAHRRGGPGRDRPAPDRHPRRVRAQPVGAVHGHQRAGDHLVPGQRLLLGGRAGPRRARHPRERRDRALREGAGLAHLWLR